MWGPPFSMPTPTLRPPPEVEVQLREWPTLPPASPSLEAVKIEAPPAAKPVLPPNTQALQDAVQTALTPVRPDRVEIQLPERLPALPPMDSQHDAVRLAEGLRDSLRDEPRLADVAVLPDLPAPEGQRAETKAL